LTFVNPVSRSLRFPVRAPDWVFARSTPMLDILMLAIGLGFFVLSIGYCYACDRL